MYSKHFKVFFTVALNIIVFILLKLPKYTRASQGQIPGDCNGRISRGCSKNTVCRGKRQCYSLLLSVCFAIVQLRSFSKKNCIEIYKSKYNSLDKIKGSVSLNKSLKCVLSCYDYKRPMGYVCYVRVA